MGFSLGKALGAVATGGLSLLGGSSGSKIGGLLNDVTGATSAGKVNQQYAKELAKINQQYALESMAKQYEYERTAALNAHQWEMSDYEKAGLNPILSAGGNGASADVGLTSGSGSAGSMQAGGAMASELVNSITSAGKASAEYKLMNAQATKLITENKYTPEHMKSEIAKNNADATLKNEARNTEIAKQNQLFWDGMTKQQQSEALRLSNILDQADIDMFERLGITRRELVDIGKTGIQEILGLFKAGKYADAISTADKLKKGKKPQIVKKGNKI